jgi:hypothetical protein
MKKIFYEGNQILYSTQFYTMSENFCDTITVPGPLRQKVTVPVPQHWEGSRERGGAGDKGEGLRIRGRG